MKTYASDWPIDDTLRKVIVNTATAGTFNAIFLVTAKGGATMTKTISVVVNPAASLVALAGLLGQICFGTPEAETNVLTFNDCKAKAINQI
jgi:hypothetical protein